MNEDAPGYGRKSRSPSGYCKLTMPNKIICYAQGLQQLPKGQIYRLYLMSKVRQKSVEIGMFQVEADGNKETRWTIEPTDINNSGINAKEIDGALVMVDGEGVKHQTVPLVGFISEAYRWTNLIEPKTKLKPETEPELELEPEPEPVLEPEPEPEPEPVLEPEPELVPEAECELFSDLPLERFEQADMEVVLRDEINVLQEEIKRLNQIIEAGKLEKARDANMGISDFLGRFQKTHKKMDYPSNNVMENVFKQRIPMHPFQESYRDIKWVRISHADLLSFSHLDYEWANQSLIIKACNDYKHLILGRDELGITYYLGIPDVFQSDKSHLLEIERIERFTCRKKGPAKAGEVGYWIALI